MTNLEQLAEQLVRDVDNRAFISLKGRTSVKDAILAALRSIAEQKDAEAAALRIALEATWRECEMGHIVGGPDDLMECGQCGASAKTEDAIAHEPDCFQSVIANALKADAGTALLRELEELRVKCETYRKERNEALKTLKLHMPERAKQIEAALEGQ